MTSRKFLLTAVAAIALFPLAACSTASSTPPRTADLSFSQMQPLTLNVTQVQVIDQSTPVTTPANRTPMRASPSMALHRYVQQRLRASGGDGSLNFVIQQASITSAESEGSGTWTDAFLLSKPMEYTVTMRVGLDLVNAKTRPNVRSAYTLERKKTLSAGASLADRDRELNLLIETMVRDMDKAVQTGLSSNMHVLVSPGAVTFGRPAPFAEPLDDMPMVAPDVVMPAPVTSGTPITAPAPRSPASAAPVVIRGARD